MILRDIDLIKEPASLTYVNIACTITTMDEEIRSFLEPMGVSSMRRFQVLYRFKDTQAHRAVHIMPIIPFLTDTYENLDLIYHHAKKVAVDYVLPGVLYLCGQTKP